MKDILLALIDCYAAAVKAGDRAEAEALRRQAMAIVRGI